MADDKALVEALRKEERDHRSGYPGPRRRVADLMDHAADRIEALSAPASVPSCKHCGK